MRIVQTSNGRYAKVLSPQMQGLIGRLYQEIRDRKASDDQQNSILDSHENDMTIIGSQMETMLIRYAEITDIVRQLFPEDEPVATIDRPLIVSGSVKATTFIGTEENLAPLTIKSKALVSNLNVEFLNGNSLSDVHTTMDNKVSILNADVTTRFAQAYSFNEANYTPINHIGLGGTSAHPDATPLLSGFMSAADKESYDELMTSRMPAAENKLATLELPGGIKIGNTAPVTPKVMQVWIDTN